jgi:hypothetical protein
MSVVIHSVVNAVHNLITGKTVVNAMREERPPVESDDGIDYQYGIGEDYDRINTIMEEVRNG